MNFFDMFMQNGGGQNPLMNGGLPNISPLQGGSMMKRDYGEAMNNLVQHQPGYQMQGDQLYSMQKPKQPQQQGMQDPFASIQGGLQDPFASIQNPQAYAGGGNGLMGLLPMLMGRQQGGANNYLGLLQMLKGG